jgi:hypothetical protein
MRRKLFCGTASGASGGGAANSIWWTILKLARTFFAAEGGENKPP